MGYAILRIEKRKTSASTAAMLKHALREVDVPNAVEGAPRPTVLAGRSTSAEAMSDLRSGKAAARAVPRGWSKVSTSALDLLVTTSHEDAGRLSKSQYDTFFKKALAFIERRFGGAKNILSAVIHRDESTPHMQVILMPIDEHGRFSAGKMLGNKAKMCEMQDDFYESTDAEKIGLKRGERGTGAKHVKIKAFYGAMAEGMEPPKMMVVPPAPGMTDRLRPGYGEKKKANADALAHNAAQRKRVLEQAKVGRSVHPVTLERQATRYRASLANEAVALKAVAEAKTAAAAAEKGVKDAQIIMDRVKVRQVELDAQSSSIDTMSAAAIFDKMSKHLDKSVVREISQRLGIELQPGKGLCDQVRRAGRAKNLLEAAQLLDRAYENQDLRKSHGGPAATP